MFFYFYSISTMFLPNCLMFTLLLINLFPHPFRVQRTPKIPATKKQTYLEDNQILPTALPTRSVWRRDSAYTVRENIYSHFCCLSSYAAKMCARLAFDLLWPLIMRMHGMPLYFASVLFFFERRPGGSPNRTQPNFCHMSRVSQISKWTS